MAEDVKWWASLKHGGLLIAPSRLIEFFPDDPKPLPPYLTEQLRRALTRLEAQTTEADREFLDLVLEQVCGLGARWEKGAQVDKQWSQHAITGEIVKPRRIWYGAHDAKLPVFVTEDVRLGVGRGRRMVSRVVEWLRTTGLKLALLSNIRQFRLIHAGLDYDAYAEWDTDLWFEEGHTGPQITALQALLCPQALEPHEPNETPPLLAAIQASRRGQAELSAELGERVRQAVELLIQTHGPALQALGTGVSPRHIYLAATRLVMRMVVVLFAEARDLLPRDNAIYYASYGLQGLRETLDRIGGGTGKERLRHRFGAWPRVLGLFRLVCEGSHHQTLLVPRYGGDLFAPGQSSSPDPTSRALAVFENPGHEQCPSDAVVHLVLNLLCRTSVKVRQGRGSTRVYAPVDFSDLSSEYIGILYEGLLDYELRRTEEPVVFLALGDEPALPLPRLEAMDDTAMAQLVEKFKVKRQLAVAEEETEGEDDEGEDLEASDGEDAEEESEEASRQEGETTVSAEGEDPATLDSGQRAREQAQAWARRAVTAGRIVPRPRGRSATARQAYEEAVAKAARDLITKEILPGEWYLVRWGGTRKGAGTFYTRPQLAVPTVQRTLRPLAYDPPHKADGTSDEDAPPTSWKPKPPEQILSLKVCDPAVGSGSFLVASLRFLTDALYGSLHHHARIHNEADKPLVTLIEGQPSQGHLTEEHLRCRADADDFEPRLRARLKRYVVERCLYGVDLDPLAIELARLALWIETMDRDLPFEFLDHKLKVGNSLVGCWFDRFRDYPVLAWNREGGDKNHTNGVHCEKEAWTKAIKLERNKRIKQELAAWIAGQRTFLDDIEGRTPEAVHDQAHQALETMRAVPVHDPERQAIYYREHVLNDPAFKRLKEAFDTWCAIWVWPPDRLDEAPTPRTFENPPDTTRELVAKLTNEHRFFHWELEFPDVFAVTGGGFNAMVGNPPWEIQKPNSKEFFSNLDPLYRTYSKQEALRKQKELFTANKDDERAWLDYVAHFKALANFGKHAASPFGDGTEDGDTFSFGKGSAALHETWRARREGRHGYADAKHPFRYQGSADINTYKRFLEQSLSLLRPAGRVGMITPAGVYSDKGATALRNLFLDQCRWEWLFSFINWFYIFPSVYYRVKFCPIIIQKGETTQSISTAFMQRHLSAWENAEQHVIHYTRSQVESFSPETKALLEIQSPRDLAVLEKLYSQSVLVGDNRSGWGIKFSTEFHMTNDSSLFVRRSEAEARGYFADPYGRWIHPDEEECLPVYQGTMIGQVDFSASAYERGIGPRSVWSSVPWEAKNLAPQFVMKASDFSERRIKSIAKVVYRSISYTTNERTFISALIPNMPCGNSLNVLSLDSTYALFLPLLLNSFCFDWSTRKRMGGSNLNWFVISELPLPKPDVLVSHLPLWVLSARLQLVFPGFAHYLLVVFTMLTRRLGRDIKSQPSPSAALTSLERVRIRSLIDAVVAELYGLDWDDLAWILRDCDHPVERLSDKAFTRSLDPKGFWRVDKNKDPELRHTVLTLVAFRDLKETVAAQGGNREAGIEAFCSQQDRDSWMLPETLCLDDLGLGHDRRAKEPQPVLSRLGERFLPWQLEQSVEESWAECERDARNILGDEGFSQLQAELRGDAGNTMVNSPSSAIRESTPTYAAERLTLFGNAEPPSAGKGRKR